MNILVDKRFETDWVKNTDATGTLSVENGILRCVKTGGAGNGRAMLRLPILAKEGSRVEIEIMARVEYGADVRVGIDSFYEGCFETDYVSSKSNGWEKIRLCHTFKNKKYLDGKVPELVLGIWNSLDAGIVEYKNPIIRLYDSYPSPLVIATGLIGKITIEEAISVRPTYKSFGILNVEPFGNDAVKVKIDYKYTYLNAKIPIPFISGTTDSIFQPHCGDFDLTDNSFLIKFSNKERFLNINEINKVFFTLVIIS